jgi:glucosamine--fructose-6-phosphate aminotransferase (isomerizing)
LCGIIGYTGNRNALEVILEGLKRLEYRGYDSVGIAVGNHEIRVYKRRGSVSALESDIRKTSLSGTIGIGHTRWATHGEPSDRNAHPFLDCTGRFALVHNGIIENYQEIKEELRSKGHSFTSDTDTEVIVHLIEDLYEGDILKAVMGAVSRLDGSFAIVVMAAGERRLIGVRKESPLVIGLGEGENFLASDVPAFLKYTNRAVFLQDGDIAVITANSWKVLNFGGEEVKREVTDIPWNVESAEKGGFKHFMLKEIFEQPYAIMNTLRGTSSLYLRTVDENDFERIKIVACGTSYHAGMIGKYVFEEMLRIPVDVDVASEFRYRERIREDAIYVFITQSGETADTLAAARIARRMGHRTIAITNVIGSSITREVDEVIYTNAGPEIGVAATKSFTTQIVAIYRLAQHIAEVRGLAAHDDLWTELRLLPRLVSNVLQRHSEIEDIARTLKTAQNMFYIGRNISYPTALEGALKMKEISYIHAEGYPAGELKHGPLALLTPKTPVVALVPPDRTYMKMLGNVKEVAARGAPVIGVGAEGDEDLIKYVDRTIYVPRTRPIFYPVPISVALQLLAYYTADMRGCEIDKPRNLAKSVTVE